MATFTQDEIRRIHENLTARFLNGAYPGVLAIGFGPKWKDDEKVADHPFTVCFFVRHKRTPRNPALRLPAEVSVRLKRGRKFETILFRTDVVEQKRLFRATAHHVVENGGIEALGAVGAVIRWPSDGDIQWALLTVGHFLRDVGPITPFDPILWIRTDPTAGGFQGRLLVRSTSTESVDAAVIAVDPADLLAFAILDPATAFPLPVVSVSMLQSSLAGPDLPGITLPPPPGITPGLLAEHFLPSTGTMIAGFPSLTNAIRCRSTTPLAFKKGTSGSVWQVMGDSAALQVAGLPTTFDLGLGQCLETQLEWVRDNLQLPNLPELMGVV